MSTQTRVGPYSFADFLEFIREDQKADLLDGTIFMASPENLEHNDLVGWLGFVLRGFVDARGLGAVTLNRVAYRLSDRSAPEPDLAFVRADRRAVLKRGYVDGPPDLAIELVSPDSVERDYDLKRRRYEEAGVREYWIIDPQEQRTTFLIRDERGFVEALIRNDRFASVALPGLEIDVRWLWQRPLPSPLPVLQSLLAGS